MSMELSVWSSFYKILSPEDAMAELVRHGYHFCELSDEHADELLKRGESAAETGRKFKEYCDSIGMCVPQGHLYLKLRICSVPRDEVVETLGRWFDLFEAIGIKNAVLHCDRIDSIPDISKEEIIDKNAAVIKKLTEMLKGRDLTICLENLKLGCSADADELLQYVDRIGSDNLGICLDTGHLNISGGDQVEFIRKAGKHLKALHIADNEGETDQHIMPFGRGTVDIKAVVGALKEIGYTGIFNFEIPGDARMSCPLEIRGYKLEYIRKMYDYIMR